MYLCLRGVADTISVIIFLINLSFAITLKIWLDCAVNWNLSQTPGETMLRRAVSITLTKSWHLFWKWASVNTCHYHHSIDNPKHCLFVDNYKNQSLVFLKKGYHCPFLLTCFDFHCCVKLYNWCSLEWVNISSWTWHIELIQYLDVIGNKTSN